MQADRSRRRRNRTFGEPAPDLIVHPLHLVRLADRLTHLLAVAVVRLLRFASHGEHGEVRSEQVLGGELVECREQLAAREVSGGPEDDHRAWIRTLGRPRHDAILTTDPRRGADSLP